MKLPSQTKIEREGRCHMPVVLKESSENVSALAPRAAVDAAADFGRQTHHEIRFRDAGAAAGGGEGIGAGRITPIERECARASVIARIEGVNAVSPALKSEMHGVDALADGQGVLVLDHRVRKKLV